VLAKHLEIFELREKAMSARDKATEARRLAARVADAATTRVSNCMPPNSTPKPQYWNATSKRSKSGCRRL
jgi:hypothetical protein